MSLNDSPLLVDEEENPILRAPTDPQMASSDLFSFYTKIC